ncbi:cysteine protease family [Plasmopara halstedii]|uniref:Cysteine protease family n=1 Tax=Plasmopara halstedii TaxID=4781 RepID=A0A0N7L7Z5_PLAHL|nr:cysteine protease family [Plasmopara halstedii]CEG48451.1 cysteine protease family [Plasmopara halstedii]|eukprot:XP_024584820.1 cysteine protease family [Plasmopara halstedii]
MNSSLFCILRIFLLSGAMCGTTIASIQAATELELRTQQNQAQRIYLGPTRATEKLRAQAFAKTARIVDETNALHAAGLKSYYMSYNNLSDLTDEQYQAFLMSKPDKNLAERMHVKEQARETHMKRGKQVTIGFDLDPINTKEEEIEILKGLDWRTKDGGKYVTPIKNQGTCGSCWAFAGVAVIESRFAIENNVIAPLLSVEQVLSCSGELDHIQSKFYDKMTSSSEGCLGGMPFLTYSYLQLAPPHGIACEHDYPYAMATNETHPLCLSESMNVSVTWKSELSDYKVVASNEEALLRAVMTGPVTANIDAGGNGFRHYGGGIYDAQDCSNDGVEVNHAVVVVGFGETERGEKYWILRNTWGTMWGEDGYMRIARGESVEFYGPCNLYLYADYPVNLTFGPRSSTCVALARNLTPLSFQKLIELSFKQVVILGLCTVLTVIAGIALYHGTEFRYNRKEAAGEFKYKDSYARWILPSRDQLATALAQRSTQHRTANH